MLCTLAAFPSVVNGGQFKKPSFRWSDIEYVYAFGDSYTFVQGTLGHANFSFIGDAFNLPFTPKQLLSNQIIPKNTSSDGSNWIEFLTGCLGGHPSSCRRQLWDFAFAGSDIDANLLPLHHNFTVPLVDQVKQFVTYAKDVIPHPAKKTLTAWWIGINDTGDSSNNASITDWNAFWDAEMTSYFNAVQSAFDNGLRGAHLFINVPPEERNPASLGKNNTAYTAHIQQYNSLLADYVANFAKKNPSDNVLTFDAHTWFNKILDDASAYGFTNTTGFCECKDSSYFWFNTGHPTEHVHRLLAQAIEQHLEAASIKRTSLSV
ncbi:hypothetical protein PUNSTDRAFT_60790 [Punctularia strigosozonata HHB-11173 SS5]|uniref:uncharacterized protein n=1 Tax=Punctularia strigosozonata (strain HHB-11173) TaxID=741275 RepID=UPI00044165D7|nr:uncharacterized protein PUNSTDRAFT_60790 [Punctularia strigosozonata HHB-11173 SS5]EIN12675.1 hypothetical protein PUNSTDRAFT_60790 [Punctularia strigosozonata HHB-11173 SS5]